MIIECEFVLCVYNKYGDCLLSAVGIDSNRCCDGCLYLDVPDLDNLKKDKRNQLKEMTLKLNLEKL